MARLIPELTEQEISDAHGSQAETHVYSALRDGLPDSVIVLYSVPWVEPRKGLSPQDGEADFVILDPRRGMLVGEVKGGQVEVYSGNRWIRRTEGRTEDFRSPFEQALNSRKVFERYCKREIGIDLARIGSGHFVAFPDTSIHLPNIGPGAPGELTIYGDELPGIRDRIGQIFDYWQGGSQNPDVEANWVDRVAELLMPTRALKPSLGAQVISDEQQFLALTLEQSKILGLLGHVNRARIDGAAGTGKTVLAMEKARKMAANGKRTLLTCFNRPLADRMASQLSEEANLQVLTYHEVCRLFAEKAGLSLPDRDAPMPSEYFSEELPGLLLESLDLLPEDRFDALVVDEGQDFHRDWWVTLTLLLEDTDECPIYVFNDAGQNLFQDDVFDPDDLQLFGLSENVRNTQQIHSFAQNHSTTRATLCNGPAGRPVEFIEADGERERRQALSRSIHRLVNEEGVNRDDITIVTGRSVRNSCLYGLTEVGAFALRQVDQDGVGILVESAWRFKGLESPVIILIDFPSSVASSLRYVAATRAQSHLVIIGSAEENSSWIPVSP